LEIEKGKVRDPGVRSFKLREYCCDQDQDNFFQQQK
jgi:hypothetical protein